MPDNVIANPGAGGATFASDDIAGVQYPRGKITLGADGVNDGDVSSSNPMPVGGALLTSIDGKLPTVGQKVMAASQPVVIASDQTALPLSTGAATAANQATEIASLSSIDSKLPALVTTVPFNGSAAPPSRVVGQDIWVCSFAASGASVLSSDFTTPVVGTGVTYNQTSGSLNILTGTTTNAEFFTRSVQTWRGSLRMRASIVASQRIANQNLALMLADLIGEGLSYTIVSATVVNVTRTAHGFTSQNVGQFMNLAAITGAAGVPGRYAIAAIVDANTIQFTVAGWTASGSGTLTLFGWNFVRNLVNGVTATNIAFTAQRRGWADADTTAVINSTASPGTIIQNDLNGRDTFLMDQVRATATTPTFTTRASRYENIPDDDAVLYMFIWNFNGTVAPASTTTWTLGFIAVEKYANTPVYVQGLRANGTANPLPVNIASPATLPVSLATNTPTLAAGTNLAADVGVQVRATTNGTTVTNILSAATNNLTQLKATAGKIAGGFLTNTTASLQYVKLFNVPSASVTMGTTAATTQIALQPNQTVNLSQGDLGIFIGGTGLTIAIVTGSGLTDNTATTAGSVVGFIAWV